ncbi:MAG: PilZ domain-containing protein, partial [Acidobacteriota bacterium]
DGADRAAPPDRAAPSNRVNLEDLSLGGARLVSTRDIATGTDVVLALRESSALPRQVALPGRVIRSRPLLDRPGFEAVLMFSVSNAPHYKLAGILADLDVGGSASRETNG